MVNLNEEDKSIIKRLRQSKLIKLSIGTYLVKKVKIINGISELIGTYFGTKMGLIVPKSHLLAVDGGYYILSENLNDLGEFTVASKEFNISNDNISLLDAWVILEEKYGNAAFLVKDIVKIYIFDVLFHNTDRWLDNWGFITYLDGSKRIVMFDNEYVLDYGADTTFLHTGNTPRREPLHDFVDYLRISSSEFIELFKDYYDIFTPEYFKEALEEIIKEHNLNSEDFNFDISLFRKILETKYEKNYQDIGNIYEQIVAKKER